MKRATGLSVVIAAVMGVMMAGVTRAQADVIISDQFSGSNGAAQLGRTPDTKNLPGGTWTVVKFNSNGGFYSYLDTSTGNTAPSVVLQGGGNSTGLTAISMASHLAYTKPTLFTLSVDLRVWGGRPLGIGFYSALPGASPDTVTTGFTGLVVNSNTSLILYENGVAGTSVALVSTLANSTYYHLSYTVNTVTGAISGVTLGGNTYSFTTTAFNNSATQFTGAMLAGSTRDVSVRLDNFQITTIPEPATLALLGIGTLLIASRRRRIQSSATF